ncbi:unnamed protein product [Phytomonas sp. EM1]|nr:unnamed protein product [Phytomonas sp. EM1]|eukprot:CCW61399.1 unnamed protein product [Phytomonas sp. isolate EM1]
MFKDYYHILGVPPHASAEAIRSAFKQLALQCHPDKVSQSTSVGCSNGIASGARSLLDYVALPKFTDVQEAYEVLGDVARRYLYDLNYTDLLNQQRALQEQFIREQQRERSLAAERERAAQALREKSVVDVPAQKYPTATPVEIVNDSGAKLGSSEGYEESPTESTPPSNETPEVSAFHQKPSPSGKQTNDGIPSREPLKQANKPLPTTSLHRKVGKSSQRSTKSGQSPSLTPFSSSSAQPSCKLSSSSDENTSVEEVISGLRGTSLGVPSTTPLPSLAAARNRNPSRNPATKASGKSNASFQTPDHSRVIQRTIEVFFLERGVQH